MSAAAASAAAGQAQPAPPERLPSRVNLVWGRSHALLKRGRGDRPVSCAPAAAFLASKARRGQDGKWRVQVALKNRLDGQGRLMLCHKLRLDRHPQRSLRSGDPVGVDDRPWTPAHYWLLEYAPAAPRSLGAVGCPFHLRSLADRRYLVVDAASGGTSMQHDEPANHWEFHDACASESRLELTKAIEVKAPPTAPAGGGSEDEEEEEEGESTPTAPAGGGSEEEEEGESTLWQPSELGCFKGSITEAFSECRATADGHVHFAPPEPLADRWQSLGEDVAIAPTGTSTYDVFQALYGLNSTFCQEVASGKDVVFSPVQRVNRHCSVVGWRQTIALPSLGPRRQREDTRFALVQDGIGFGELLVIQASQVTHLGFPFGDFSSDALHLASAAAPGEPVRLRSFAHLGGTWSQHVALNNMRQERVRFVALLRKAVGARFARAAPRAAPRVAPRSGTPSSQERGQSSQESYKSSCSTAERGQEGVDDLPPVASERLPVLEWVPDTGAPPARDLGRSQAEFLAGRAGAGRQPRLPQGPLPSSDNGSFKAQL